MKTGVGYLLLGALVAIVSSCRVDTNSGACVIGPCGPPTNFKVEIVQVVGVPASIVVSGVARLVPGDTLGLNAVRFTTGSACTAADTVRDSLRWGVTDSLVATITPMPGGHALLRAKANGIFNVLMLQGPYGTVPPGPAASVRADLSTRRVDEGISRRPVIS